MNAIELRQASAEATRLGRPLAGYSARQLQEIRAALPERSALAIELAPAHIRARLLENRAAKLGILPEPEVLAPVAPSPVSVDLAARLSVLQSL